MSAILPYAPNATSFDRARATFSRPLCRDAGGLSAATQRPRPLRLVVCFFVVRFFVVCFFVSCHRKLERDPR